MLNYLSHKSVALQQAIESWSFACTHEEKPSEVFTEIGDKVRFNIADVFLQAPEGGLVLGPDESVVEGTVISFSDSGEKTQAFAVVDVINMRTMVVPVEKVQMVQPGEAAN